MRRAILTLAALALASSPAWGYVRTRTSTGTPVAWRKQCPELSLSSVVNPDFSTDRLRAALEKSAKAWNDATTSCDDPKVVIDPGTVSGKDVGDDGVNLVIWRLPGFCDAPAHQSDDVCTSPNAAAVTTIFFRDDPGQPDDGELLETDMEINAVDFKFSDNGDLTKLDLQNTLTHELGHVFGLDHTCYTVPGSAPPVDSDGNPVPRCFPLANLPEGVKHAVMYNFEQPGETDKRLPTSEETKGLCAIYSGRAQVCEREGQGGCSFIPPGQALPIGGFALLVLLLGGIILIRRRSS